MSRLFLTVLCALLGSLATPASADLLSAKGPVYAIVAGERFVGEAEGHLEAGGKGQMRCTNGLTATFTFKRLTARSGHGTGKLRRGTMRFTYGLSAEEASPYLASTSTSKK